MDENFTPTLSQKLFVENMSELINKYLWYWGSQSGKTTARKLLCQRIMDDDK